MFAVSFATSVLAHELEPGQVLYSSDFSGERIETFDLFVAMDILAENDFRRYSITLRSRETGLEAIRQFEEFGGPDPNLAAYNRGYYCDQSVVFITVEYPIPRMADILQRLFETHAFLAETLEYLDTANARFEDIAPLESGVDLGFPYEMPQRYIVECTPATGTQSFEFSFTDRNED